MNQRYWHVPHSLDWPMPCDSHRETLWCIYGRRQVYSDTPSPFPFIYHGASNPMTLKCHHNRRCFVSQDASRQYRWQHHFRPNHKAKTIFYIRYALFSCSDVARYLQKVHFHWVSTPYLSLQLVYLASFRYKSVTKKTGIATQRPLLLFNLNCSRMKNEKISMYSLYYSYYWYYWHYWYCSIQGIFLNSLHFGHTQYCCFVFLL